MRTHNMIKLVLIVLLGLLSGIVSADQSVQTLPDGSTQIQITSPDGTSVVQNEQSDGSASAQVQNPDGSSAVDYSDTNQAPNN